MANREKNEKEKPFPERFKRFMKSDKKNIKSLPEVKLTEEMMNNISFDSPFPVRLKTMKEIEDSLINKKIEENGLEKVWIQIKDLLNSENSLDQREAALTLLGAVILNTERLAHNRVIFITYVMENYKKEDPHILFDFFRCLTSDGRQLEYVEELVGPVLLDWLPALMSSYKPKRIVIEYVTNLLKFNAAHFDDHIVHELILVITNQLLLSSNMEELYACLSFLDMIIAYVYIPYGTLNSFVCVLTRLASIPLVVDDAWKVMRNLLRTELGNTSLCSLCEIIETSDNFHFVRGAIYYLTNALWTKARVKSLTFTPMAILPTLQKASESLHPLVIYETAISLSKLVRNFSHELHLSSWDLLLDVLARLLYFTGNYSVKENAQMIYNVINTTIDDIEDRIETNQFKGTISKFYDLVNQNSEQRQDKSVLQMLDFKIRKLNPTQLHWLIHLTSLINKHFRKDPRPAVRLQALSKLRYIIDKFSHRDAVAICKTVVITQLDEIEQDPDVVVRKAAVSLLVHIILSIHDPLIEKILLFLERIVLSPYALRGLEDLGTPRKFVKEEEAEDLLEGIKGLIMVFKKKMWCLPSSYAIQAYQILMSSLEFHYRFPHVLENLSYIRKSVFDMIFEMRADASYHLGLPNCDDAQIAVSAEDPQDLLTLLPKYSPYIIVDHKYGQKPISGYAIFNGASSNSSVDSDSSSEEEDQKGEDSNMTNKKSDKPLMLGVPHEKISSLSLEQLPRAQDDRLISSEEEETEKNDRVANIEGNEPSIVVTHLSLTKAARIVIVAMKNEKDWSLLKMILERIPQVLQNKALILSKEGNDIDYLATTLCALVSDNSLNLPGCLHNTPPKFSRSDFQGYVYPVMAALASYHQHLDSVYQMNIIRCLQFGMLSKSSPMCVSAMTLCVLEMRTAMTKMLMDVMLKLSQISATVQNAQPTLEFLSTLLHLPRVYSDFSKKQTCTVFAISIPYTNPFKFNHYIVSLAYHVICMWFLKCRVPYRKYFVSYIAKNLNMILLNEEAASKIKGVGSEQGELQGRARTTRAQSLSALTIDKNEMARIKLRADLPLGSIIKKGDTDMIQFHKDIRETCVDFMARNCFDTYSPVVKRSEIAEMLLKTGQQQMWLIGTRIITVTTSGCSKRPIKQGLCDKCIQMCGIETDSPSPADSLPSQDCTAIRRRHKSDFHRSVSHEAKHMPQSKDDLHMKSSSKEQAESDQVVCKEDKNDYLCACWCRGWAEVFIRQPTGNISFMVRSQNPRTQISRDDTIPVQELSSFYSPVSQSTAESSLLNKQDSSSSDRVYDVYSPQMLESMRPRALSGGSEPTQPSETGIGLVGEWSNSGSGPSSGAASLASSELKLDTKVEGEPVGTEVPHIPVYHCHSNPEVNKGMMESSGLSADGVPRHHILSHSVSLVEGSSAAKAFKDDSAGKGKSRCSSAVRQTAGFLSSPSPPPHSDETSRIRHSSALQMKSCTSSVVPSEKDEEDELERDLEPVKRLRGHTISDMNPASRNMNGRNMLSRRTTLAATGSLEVTTASTTSLPSDASANFTSAITASSATSSSSHSSKNARDMKSGVSPSSVFLQLYYQGCFGGSCFRPILIPPEHETSVKLLDLINPHEHHRIGVIYVGPDQSDELEILRNTSGSERYYCFLEGLGTVHDVRDLVAENINIGGLDKRGLDGKLIYMWQDDLMQVIFHVATAIPIKETDKNFSNKKRHIGNDYVTIVYNNSGKSYRYDTIKSQFNHSIVEIIPGDHNTNCVKLTMNPDKQELSEFVSWGKNDTPRLVSDVSLPVLVRQLALHANLASTVWQSLKGSSYTPYATTWLERLRKIRKLREKIVGKDDSDRHLLEMQEMQFPPLDDPNEVQNLTYLDFSDMIEIDKTERQERNKSAGFLSRR